MRLQQSDETGTYGGRLGLDTGDGICGAMDGVSLDVHSLKICYSECEDLSGTR